MCGIYNDTSPNKTGLFFDEYHGSGLIHLRVCSHTNNHHWRLQPSDPTITLGNVVAGGRDSSHESSNHIKTVTGMFTSYSAATGNYSISCSPY